MGKVDTNRLRELASKARDMMLVQAPLSPAQAIALLDEVERLRKELAKEEAFANDLTAERDQLRAERDEARKNYQFMVERAADQKLDGYRELGERAARAENERDAAVRERDEARGLVARWEKLGERHDLMLREPGCQCQYEIGDSPCPIAEHCSECSGSGKTCDEHREQP